MGFEPTVEPSVSNQKLDGIRALCLSGTGLVSRTFKPIANLDIRETLENILPKDIDCDGELIAGNFQETAHRVMSVDEKTSEWCENLSKGLLGKPKSEEHRKNMIGKTGPKKGRKHSPETIEKMRIAATGRKWANGTWIRPDNLNLNN